MIKLYRKQVSSQADAIEAEFKDMVLGYDREIVSPAEAKKLFGADHVLPIITDNQKMVSGDDIPGYIKELRNFVRDWQRFQGDSCYVDDDGEVC
jgi:hypothetical protein